MRRFLAVFNLVNNMRFSFKNGSGLNGVSSQMGVGHRFGNLLHNGGRGSNHRGVVNHRGGSSMCNVRSSSIRSSNVRSGSIRSSNIRSGSGNHRGGSGLNFNRFNRFNSDRGSRGSIGVIGIRITVTTIVVIRVVVESVVTVVVAVVTISIIVVAIVISGFGLSLGFSLGVSFTLGQTGFLQSFDSATVGGDTIMRSEGAMGNSYTSGNTGNGGCRNCVGGSSVRVEGGNRGNRGGSHWN
jgi:hypothetical protein